MAGAFQADAFQNDAFQTDSAAALAGTSAAVSSTSGALTTAIRLVGTSAAVSTLTGTLAGGSAALAGTVTAVSSTTSATLTTAIRLVGSSTAAATVTGSTLVTAIGFAGSVSASSGASGYISGGIGPGLSWSFLTEGLPATINLFRGQVIGVKVDVIGSDCLVTIDCEDYNRLPPLIPVGAPDGNEFLTQADGTAIVLDPRGGLTGATQAFKTFADGGYWPDASLVLDTSSGFLAPEVPGLPLIDFTTALSDLKSFIDTQAVRVSGALRWWIAPPLSGDGLVLYWVDYLDPLQTALLPAPYEIDNDTPDWTTRVMPEKLSVSWDWANIRGSNYIRGGTPAPEGSGFGTGIGNSPTGTGYVDAPGSITDDDRAAIGLWHQYRDFIERLTGSATMPPGVGATSYTGWRVGQTAKVTSVNHSRLTGHELAAREAVIQTVTGRVVTPLNALTITIDGAALDKPFEWQSFSFEEILGSPGKATAVIHLLGPTDTLTIAENADVWITVDTATGVDIEYDLAFGDIPAGALTRELAKIPDPPDVQPVYHFNVTYDLGLPPGQSCVVKAQLADSAQSPVQLPGLPMEWVITANDIDGNPVDTTGYLTDDVGTTDTGGAVFNTLTIPSDSTARSITIYALALPIA